MYIGRVDCLITEDKKMLQKAELLGIDEKVFSISSFIEKCTNDYPELIPYKHLSVVKRLMGDCDVNDSFFDPLRNKYKEFNKWFQKKSEEECYVCKNDNNEYLGFLYLKVEKENEPYTDIYPVFSKKKRLKVGTFRTITTGFRLGERFLKIIFDNAKKNKVEEIYVTLFDGSDEIEALKSLFIKWGFVQFGTKKTENGEELVFVKSIGCYDKSKKVIENFPNLPNNNSKYIMPIIAQHHIKLFPDALLNNEKDYEVDQIASRYSLLKMYISFAYNTNGAKAGDYVLFYRMAEGYNKKYNSVITGYGIINSISDNFQSINQYLKECNNRTVFTKEELDDFWKNKNKLVVVSFIYIGAFSKKQTLNYLHSINVVEPPNGPRPFTKITDSQFESIIKASGEII